MPLQHEEGQHNSDDTSFRSIEAKEKYCVNGRNHHTADAQVLRDEDDDHSGDHGQKSPEWREEEDGGAGCGDAFSAFEFLPEREIVTECRAEAGIEDSEMPQRIFKEQIADEGGQDRLQKVSDQDDDAGFKTEISHDVCHARIACPAEFGTGLSCQMACDDFRG